VTRPPSRSAQDPAGDPPPSRIPPAGLALLLLLTLIWGTNWPFMKIAVLEIPILVFRTYCALGVGVLMLSVAAISGHPLRVPRRNWRALCLAAFFNITVWFFVSAIAIRLTSAGHTVITAYTMPLYVFLIDAVMFRARPSATKWIGLALGMTAIGLLAVRDFQSTDAHWLGIAVMSVGAVSWAIGATIVKREPWGIPHTTQIGWQALLGGIPFVVLTGTDLFAAGPFSLPAILSTLYVIVFGVALAFWLWFRILELVPVWVASLAVLGVPAVGLVSGAVVLGEPLGWVEITALLLLVGGVSTVLPKPGRSDPATTIARR
jgi:drug/metabolite transporter (DMT)-like permease